MLLEDCFGRWLRVGSLGFVLWLAACQATTPQAQKTAPSAPSPASAAANSGKAADPCSGRNAAFCDWPEESAPAKIGRRVAENFAVRKLNFAEGKVIV